MQQKVPSKQELLQGFPNLHSGYFEITSEATVEYNCIAWAAGATDAHWWPDPWYNSYWPEDAPREETIDAFIKAYETLGYSTCSTADFENNFEKIAIYADHNNSPKHAARQIRKDVWSSKLGNCQDIAHSLEGVSGKSYGDIVVYMKRPIPNDNSEI